MTRDVVESWLPHPQMMGPACALHTLARHGMCHLPPLRRYGGIDAVPETLQKTMRDTKEYGTLKDLYQFAVFIHKTNTWSWHGNMVN